MTDKTQAALKLALEALNTTESDCGSRAWEREQEAIIAIREALTDHFPDATKMMESAQQQKPHGWYIDGYGAVLGTFEPKSVRPGEWVPFYTSPPASKPWVGLTDDDLENAMEGCIDKWDIAEAIEAKLREKNNG